MRPDALRTIVRPAQQLAEYNFGRYSDSRGAVWYVRQHDRVCANFGVPTDRNRPQYFCARAYVHVPGNNWSAVSICRDCDLLQD
jgi:hypothetical protein